MASTHSVSGDVVVLPSIDQTCANITTWDTDYFFTDEQSTPVEDVGSARSLQTLLGGFLYQSERLEVDSGAEWPFYGAGSLLNITATGLEIVHLDDAETQRCSTINRIMADRENGI